MRAFLNSISAPGSLAKHESPSNMETESMDTERDPDSTLGMYLTDCLKTYKCKQMITFHYSTVVYEPPFKVIFT